MKILDIILIVLLVVIGGFYVRIELIRFARNRAALEKAKEESLKEMEAYESKRSNDGGARVAREMFQRYKKQGVEDMLRETAEKDESE